MGPWRRASPLFPIGQHWVSGALSWSNFQGGWAGKETNHNADCVPEENRFKFVDDLSTLEIINLLTVGMSSFNMKQQIPSDIPIHGQFIPAENLESQKYLNLINEWTENQKMIISEKKTKAMIFYYTDNHQFTTRLELKGHNIEMVDKMKILGTIVNKNLTWNENCDG